MIATATIAITVAAGVLMTIVDAKGYPSIGSGLWWAVQTVTTVGYGDNVPETTAGQVMAAVVMLFGIGFLTVITASITSGFVAHTRKEPAAGDHGPSAEQVREIIERFERLEAEQVREIIERLERIEANQGS